MSSTKIITIDDSMPSTDKHRGRVGDRLSNIHETRQTHKELAKPAKWAEKHKQKRNRIAAEYCLGQEDETGGGARLDSPTWVSAKQVQPAVGPVVRLHHADKCAMLLRRINA